MYDKKENMVRTITNHLNNGDIETAFQYFPILGKSKIPQDLKPRMKCRGDVQIDFVGPPKPKS